MMQTNESKRDWGNFFTREDFKPLDKLWHQRVGSERDAAVEIANEIIRKEIEKATPVYSYKPKGKWGSWTQGAAEEGEYTHTARLIQIEEIKRD